MFAVTNKTTRVVLFIFPQAPEFENGRMSRPFYAPSVSTASHEVIDADPPPGMFLSGHWTLSPAKEWAVVDQAAYDAAVAAKTPKPPVPETISDRQFFHALALNGLVTQAEALAAVKTGDPPAAFDAFINALPVEDQFNARMLLEGATVFERSHPLTAAFGAMPGMTPEQIDNLWRMAASL